MGATDRRLRRLTIVAAPVLMAAILVVAANTGVSPVKIVIVGIVSATFVATGLLAWTRRPANRMGRIMVAAGMFLLLDLFQGGTDWRLAPIGVIGTTIADLLLGYLILAFPSGLLRSRFDRVFLGVAAVALLSTAILAFLTLDPRAVDVDADNPYLIVSDPAIAAAAMAASNLASFVVLIGFLGIFTVRWAHASGPARRTFSPVLIPSYVLVISIMVAVGANAFGAPEEVLLAAGITQALARTLIPIGFLVAILRTRMARSAIADLVVELGDAPTPARLRDALANALGDPDLSVAYWASETSTFVAPDGAAAALPAEGSGRAVTVLERDGEPIAAILHDAALLDDPGLVASVASAMRLAVENERLQGEVEAQLGEVRESRARIVAAGDAERKRVERDLHDGAQQRLVSLTLALRLANLKLGDDADPEVRRSLEQASDEARAALGELRELARGIHPQILTEAGLGPAIESLAARSTVEVQVDNGIDRRFSPAVEAAAYFVVSEALANVAKYADAKRALVRTAWHDDELTIEIADDGVGGATPGPGGGLRGVAARLSAVDRRLEPGGPVRGARRLLAYIPTGTPAAMPG
jgi:signal transduction histidine kinase